MSGCTTIQDSTGATYTAARIGGGNPVDVEFSATPCQIGIYINGTNGPNTLDKTTVNGAFRIGIYFDNAGNNAREDHTQICVSGSNSTGGCVSGSASSMGTGLEIRNTPKFSADHTSIDSYKAGFATEQCPSTANNMTVDHTVITNTALPWSYEGGNNNFNFAQGHDSPPFQGNSCAGSAIGAGPIAANVYVIDYNNTNALVKEIPSGCTDASCVSTIANIPCAGKVTVDGSVNLFVAKGCNSDTLVYEIPAGCQSASCAFTVGGGWYNPFGMSVDGSGNLYVADYTNDAVKEVPPNCLDASCTITLVNDFPFPYGAYGPSDVVLDASGDMYVAWHFGVVEIPPGCGHYSCGTYLGGGLTPDGLGIDATLNLYVGTDGPTLAKIPHGCTSAACVTTIGGGFTYTSSVRSDPAGNVYVADTLGNAVKFVPHGCTDASCVETIGGGFNNPTGVAIEEPGLGTFARRAGASHLKRPHEPRV